MNLRTLRRHLPMEVRQWAEALRELADATGEPTAAALADKLHLSAAALSRYLQGKRLDTVFSIVSRMVELANQHDQRTWTVDELKTLHERAIRASAPTAAEIETEPLKAESDGAQAPVDEPRTPSSSQDLESAAVSQPPTSVPNTVTEPMEHPQASDVVPDGTGTAGSAPKHRGRKAVGVAVMLVLLLGTGAYYWLWDTPESGASRPGAAPDTPASPRSTAAERPATNDPAPQRRCALVITATSPVWVNLDDPEPLKWKAKDERVRLLDLPLQTTPQGTFQAVHLPKGSPTGRGWMPAGDLKPTSCAGLP